MGRRTSCKWFSVPSIKCMRALMHVSRRVRKWIENHFKAGLFTLCSWALNRNMEIERTGKIYLNLLNGVVEYIFVFWKFITIKWKEFCAFILFAIRLIDFSHVVKPNVDSHVPFFCCIWSHLMIPSRQKRAPPKDFANSFTMSFELKSVNLSEILQNITIAMIIKQIVREIM